jgi:PBP1b-binding outer membrane lipoprotein LpoB
MKTYLVVIAACLLLGGCVGYKSNLVRVEIPEGMAGETSGKIPTVQITISPYNPIDVAAKADVPINAGDSALEKIPSK